jgi:catechol 2,3-dioxygenase-like lactoylglutathione lyase family enzyme
MSRQGVAKVNTYVCPIALSVADLERTVKFYRSVFGFFDAGGTTSFRKKIPEYVQGIKGLASNTHWLQDNDKKFQLEFFQFRNIAKSPIPDDWKPYDIGMTRFAVEVKDLDQTLAKAKQHFARSVSEPVLIEDKRYATIRDIDGVLIEVKESPETVNGSCPTKVVGVAYSVQDLEKFLSNMEKGLLLKKNQSLFVDKHPLLGIKNAQCKVEILDGHKCWIEVSQYVSPTPKPSRDGMLLTDIGLSHIAVSCGSAEEFGEWYNEHVVKVLRPNNLKPMKTGKLNMLMYSKDQWGVVYETIYMSKVIGKVFGFDEQRGWRKVAIKICDIVGL